MATETKPLRRDAERNRQRILAAARELFAERGLSVTLDDVAHRAGLGVGTVYRRFASRDQLVEALFDERAAELLEAIETALAAADAWDGLSGFLERMTDIGAHDRWLKEVLLSGGEGRQRVQRIRDQMRPRAEALVRRAQAEGRLRGDFAASDLPLLQLMLGTIAEIAAPDRPELWRRFLALILDGMRADGAGAGPLPEPPLQIAAIDDVMCRYRPATARR